MSMFKTRAMRGVRNANLTGLEAGAKTEVFSFGSPEQVSRDELVNLFRCEVSGKWYAPPVSLDGLAKAFRASVFHSSPIYTKVNVLSSLFIPHKWLSVAEFERVILDYFVFGNGYFERVRNSLGGTMGLRALPAKYVRRGVDLSLFYYLKRALMTGDLASWSGLDDSVEYHASAVLHLMKPDIDQEIYGMPEYLSALPSAWLNNEATLFRLRYYRNGSHAGVIMYLTDATQSPEDVDLIKDSIRQSKGPGNFRNLFVYAPNGKKDGLQVIPMSEIAAKDEFFNIKNVTRDDLLAAHRVPRDLMSIASEHKGAGGDLNKVAMVFSVNELAPVMARLAEWNALLGEDVFVFRPYVVESSIPTPA